MSLVYPLVSVIIPVFNSGKYLKKCLESLCRQTYKELELIIVNDGSTDNSEEIISVFKNYFLNYVLVNQPNRGVANARNIGVSYAKGKYLLFVDADDYLANEYIRQLVDKAEKESADIVIGGYTIVDSRKPYRRRVVPLKYISGREEEWAYRICSAWGRLYSVKFWNDNNLFFIHEENARGEDVPVALYANVMAKRISILSDSGYYYVHHKNSAMGKMKRNAEFLFPYEAIRQLNKKIKTKDVSNSKEFYLLGIFKLFALYEFVLYAFASKEEKNFFHQYIIDEFKEEIIIMNNMVKKLWSEIKIPILHKGAITLFLIKINVQIKNNLLIN